MSLRSKLLKITFLTLTITSAILLYFHQECKREAEENERNRYNDVYNPEETDWTGELPFRKADSMELDLNIGAAYALMQSTPCCIVKFITWIGTMGNLLQGGTIGEEEHKLHTDMMNITIMDARKHKPGSFKETGFTLITLDKEPETKNWRYGSEDVHIFQKEMEKYLIEMYPQTKKFLWMSNLIRGGTKLGDQPAAPAPHLDYYQGDEERQKFHQIFPTLEFEGANKSEPNVLLGKFDTEDEKLGVILGVWKPVHPNPICDKPFAVMDAKSFKKEEERPTNTHINFLLFMFHNLGSGIVHNPEQKWYYYSHQKSTEVLVFHQYSKGTWWVNPHTAFPNKNCPKGTETRISAELRVALFF